MFGDFGPLKSVKLISTVYAEVTFVNQANAQRAAETYHNVPLDGTPLKCHLVDSQQVVSVGGSRRGAGGAAIKVPPTLAPEQSEESEESEERTEPVPDINTIHRALFAKEEPGVRTPSFTIDFPIVS